MYKKNIFIICLLGFVINFSGCGRENWDSYPSYDVRGVVVKVLPSQNALMLLHEAMEDFKDQNGRVVGMMSMAMTFQVRSDVNVETLKVADKVRAHFVVRWNKNPRLVITKLEKLLPEEDLDLDGYELE